MKQTNNKQQTLPAMAAPVTFYIRPSPSFMLHAFTLGRAKRQHFPSSQLSGVWSGALRLAIPRTLELLPDVLLTLIELAASYPA
jgi:hypothetical protein